MAARCKFGKLKSPRKGRRCKKRPSKAWSSSRQMRYGKTKRAGSTSRTAFAGSRR